MTVIYRPRLKACGYPPSYLRLSKHLPNTAPFANKFDTDTNIGHMQVPLSLRLWPFIGINFKLNNNQFAVTDILTVGNL